DLRRSHVHKPNWFTESDVKQKRAQLLELIYLLRREQNPNFHEDVPDISLTNTSKSPHSDMANKPSSKSQNVHAKHVSNQHHSNAGARAMQLDPVSSQNEATVWSGERFPSVDAGDGDDRSVCQGERRGDSVIPKKPIR